MSGLLAARLLPTLTSPPVGENADRLNRRAIMVAGDLARAVLVFGIIFARDLYALVLLLGAAHLFNSTVRGRLLERDEG